MSATCTAIGSSTKAESDIACGVMDTCGICREKLCIYKTTACHHRFCVLCLVKYVKGKKDEIVCPLCSQTITLPDGGVEGLPSYFYIDLDRNSCGRNKKKHFASSKLKWDESYFSCDHLSGGDVKSSRAEDNSAVERRRSELHSMLTDLSATARSGRERGLRCAACQKIVDGFNTGKRAIVGGVKDRAVSLRKAIQSTTKPKVPEDIKILLLGDSGSGKTYLLNKYAERTDDDPGPTLGIDFRTKDLTVDNRQVTLQLWDTSGDARFRSMISRYFSQADAVVLVYDTSHPESFHSIKTWREIFSKRASTNKSRGRVEIIHVKNAQTVENSSVFKMLASLKMGAQESSKTGAAGRAGQRVRDLAKKRETKRDEGDIETSSDSDVENPAGVTFMVIGNNRSTDDYEVNKRDVETWCHDNNIRYHVISSQDATELDMPFLRLASDVIAKREHAQ
ncbi:RAB7A [Branchiostoma lanceolatum]|uniref:RAB7A protein n=1 Tax=Branchiostoma lanceolatum TaxID=7740 RepID=A0A8K0A4D3_BRALA|nr:RAB7A [Branchiostoma lanceolatum]